MLQWQQKQQKHTLYLATSPGVKAGFMVEETAPASAAPPTATAYSGQLGKNTQLTSPLEIDRSWKRS